MTETLTHPALAALVNDGDTWWNDDRTFGFKLSVEVDDLDAITQINSMDCLGRVAWADDRNRHATRPAGFTGAAVKLHPQGWHIDSPVWWEPYRDEDGKVYNSQAERDAVTTILADGFRQVTVRRLERLTDSHGHTHVVTVDTASLCGIDSVDNGYLADVVADLLHELS